jgi:uncharacterized SAM-binding protein YcdF (DUF218 family)
LAIITSADGRRVPQNQALACADEPVDSSLMFFYLAKIIGALLLPSTIVGGAVVIAASALGWGRPALARRALAIVLLVGAASASPLPNVVILPLENRFPRADLEGAPVTGIVILGGSEDASIAVARHVHALNEAAERLTEAVALSVRLPAARVVFSGGSGALFPDGTTEGAAVRDMLVSMGIASSRLTIEDRSRTTWENASFTRSLVAPQASERWILVTSAWHMPRAIGAFRRAGFPVEAWPVDYRTRGWQDAWSLLLSPLEGLRRLDLVAKEYEGLLAYRLSGRSAELFPAP